MLRREAGAAFGYSRTSSWQQASGNQRENRSQFEKPKPKEGIRLLTTALG